MKYFVILSALIALSLLAGWRLGNRSRDSFKVGADSIDLEISQADLEMGDVWDLQQIEKTLNVKNVGTDMLHTINLQGSCSCQSFSPSEFSLKPGETQAVKVKVSLDSTGKRNESSNYDNIDLTISANTSDGKKSKSWSLHGKNYHAIQLPSHINMGDISEIESINSNFVTKVKPLIELEDLQVRSESPILKATIKKNQDHYDLTVAPAGQAVKFNYVIDVVLTPVLRNGKSTTPIKISVKFNIRNDIIAIPGVINLSQEPNGLVPKETLNIQSLSGRRFNVIDVVTSNDTISIKEVSKSGIRAYEISKNASSNSLSSGQIVIKAIDSIGNEAVLKVPVWAHATQEIEK